MDTEPWRLTARQGSAALLARQISARDWLASCLDRVRAVNPAVNALVSIDEEAALRAADQADEALRLGRPVGSLHGVPTSTKLVSDQAGSATDFGLAAFRDNRPAEDGAPIRNLRRDGAILFARSNVPGFSLRWCTQNALHGRTLNPWSADLVPGGSSGGAAAAVATGMGPLAHGSDGGGSVRFPAACCGVVGLRPSVGRVPGHNPSSRQEAGFGGQLMVAQGVLARTVDDVRLALGSLAAGDGRDPWWVPAPLQGAPLATPIRVAMSVDPSGLGVEPAIAAALRRAAAALEAAGYIVEEAEPPDFLAITQDWFRIAADHRGQLAAAYEQFADPDTLAAHRLVMGYRSYDPAEFRAALARRTTHQRRWAQFQERYPLLLCPAMNAKPFAHGFDTTGAAETAEMFRILAPMLAAPLLGIPAISVPAGVADGLPMAVQLHAPRFREDVLLDAATAIEAGLPPLTPIDPFGAAA